MRLMFLGDLHGNFNLISQYVKLYNIKDTNIIQVGDFGVGFNTLVKEKRALEFVNNVLVKNNVFVYAIRGNHDYKSYFDNDPFELSNIKLVKDYSVLNLGDDNILCIGGAVSIDRINRGTKRQLSGDFTPNIGVDSYWKDEVFNYEDSKLRDLRGINIVVTHTSPDYCPIDNSYGFGDVVNRYINNDSELKIDLMEERRNMTLAFQTIKENNDITNHYYGHFHMSDSINMYGTEHRVLGVGELWEER